MTAGQGFKTFVTGEVLTAGDVNGYLMQGINVFTNATARDAAITAPAEGQFAFTKDNNSLWYYDGAAWVASGATGDIEGVTAGVGISGGGTSGTVTITNSMATAIDAKGDLVAGTGADTFARLAVGANNLVLTADSAEATGLKWAAADPLTTKGDLFTFSTVEARLAVGANDTVLTADSTAATGLKWAAASSGGMTLLSTTTLSGASTTVSSISQSYTDLKIVIKNAVQAAASNVYMRINGINAANYNYGWLQTANGTFTQNSNEGYYQIDNITAAIIGNTDNRRVGVNINIPQYTNTTNQFIYWNSVGGAASPTYQTYVTGGAQFVGSNVTSITIGSTSSTFSSGTIYIYGVK